VEGGQVPASEASRRGKRAGRKRQEVRGCGLGSHGPPNLSPITMGGRAHARPHATSPGVGRSSGGSPPDSPPRPASAVKAPSAREEVVGAPLPPALFRARVARAPLPPALFRARFARAPSCTHGWARASSTLMRSAGLMHSILESRSMASSDSLGKYLWC
jgi:hypothetical protein